jgi:hypothetical protein
MTESKTVLADNIKHLIGSGTTRGWAISNKLDPKQISRAVNQETSITLDALDKVADALALTPAQLLTPGRTKQSQSFEMDQLSILMSKLPDDELTRLKAYSALTNLLITFLGRGA